VSGCHEERFEGPRDETPIVAQARRFCDRLRGR
jgi:hypothetical protein